MLQNGCEFITVFFRFVRENVNRRAGNLFAFDSNFQRLQINHIAARIIKKNRAFSHRRERFFVNHSARRRV
jgi:hypothetical protein